MNGKSGLGSDGYQMQQKIKDKQYFPPPKSNLFTRMLSRHYLPKKAF